MGVQIPQPRLHSFLSIIPSRIEDVKTGERKTVIGKRGKVGEEIKLKE